MKTKRLIAILTLGALLCATPVYAQGRGGGSHGGGSHSSSSGSRSGGYSSSSSSRSGGYSSSSSSRSGGYSSSSNRSSASPSRHSASPSRGTAHSSSATQSRGSSPSRTNTGVRSNSHSGVSVQSGSRGQNNSNVRGGIDGNRNGRSGDISSSRSRVGAPESTAPRGNSSSVRGSRGAGQQGSPTQGVGTSGRGSVNPQNHPGHSYARPGRPGHMPPSNRPMHPAPYFHHPYHHHMIHMHPIYWHPLPPRPIFWPGFWVYCHSYWYDYHVTDVTIVHKYIHDTYNVDMVSYAISGDLMYAIVNDVDGKTYLQVFDNSDKLLAEQEISHKYIKTEVDRENGGCWIFKKKDKDPMLFLYVDGELLIYEAD